MLPFKAFITPKVGTLLYEIPLFATFVAFHLSLIRSFAMFEIVLITAAAVALVAPFAIKMYEIAGALDSGFSSVRAPHKQSSTQRLSHGFEYVERKHY